MNNCIFSGNISREPELKFIPSSGMAVVKFSLAVNDGWGEKKTTSFLNMVAFKNTAEAIANYTTKGSKVTVRCHVKTGSYDNNEGKKVYTTDFYVDEIEFPSKKEGQPSKHNDDVFQPTDDDPFEEPLRMSDDDSIPF